MAARAIVSRSFDASEANLQPNSCLICGHVFTTNLFAHGSFYCPNPSCRIPHICIYRRPYRRRYLNIDDTTPLPSSIYCHNCTHTIDVPPIATAHYTYPIFGPCFRCLNCLITFYYYRPDIPSQPEAAIRTPPEITAPPEAADLGDDEYEVNDDDEYEVNDDDLFLPIIPASRLFINSLPTLSFCSIKSCSICIEDFLLHKRKSVRINKLPCGHCFHRECIVEWLQRSNTCPLCRYQFPAHCSSLRS